MINQKKYPLLVGDYYYPCAWNDAVGTFDTEEDALSSAKARIKGHNKHRWYEIVDLEELKVVKDGPH